MKLSLLFITLPCLLLAEPSYTPWFTGPLLAPTPINMQPGHPMIEPFFTFYKVYGVYDNHGKVEKKTPTYAINPLLDFQFGLTENIGIEIDVGFISSFRKNRRATHLQDTSILLGYQASTDQKGTWIPDFRLLLQELFPTGKYQKLDPQNQGIDITGQGSYQTGMVLAVQKYFPSAFFVFEWSLSYLFIQTPVQVKGFNTYGGSRDTRGTAKPGQTLSSTLSGQYSITQRWVLGLEFEYSHQKRSHFSGHKGSSDPVHLPVMTTWSFAPEIEYNFNSTSGLLVGAWCTLGGKNSRAFNTIAGFYYCVF